MKKALANIAVPDRATQRALDALKESVEVGNGMRGDPRERNITWGDLAALGGAKILRSLTPGKPVTGANVQLAGASTSTPERPESFAVIATYLSAVCIWDSAHNPISVYAELFRSEVDLFASATLIGRDQGTQFTDRSVQQGVTYYYWIKFVSNSGVEGPLQSTSGFEVAVPLSADAVLADISGQIKQTHLHQVLSGDLDDLKTESEQRTIDVNLLTIEGQQRTEDVAALLGAEVDAALALATAMETKRDLLLVAVGGEDNLASLEATVSEEATARADADTIITGLVTTVTAKADENEASIGGVNTALASVDYALGQRIDSVDVSIQGHSSQIQVIEQALVGQGSSYAGRIETLEVSAVNQQLTNTGDALQEAINQSNQGQIARNTAKSEARQEVLTDDVSALATTSSELEASVGENASSIIAESSARASLSESVAYELSIITTSVGVNIANIKQEEKTRVNAENVIAQRVSSTETAMGKNTSSINNIETAFTDDGSTFAASVTSLKAQSGNSAAAVKTLQEATVDATSGPYAMWSVSATVNDMVASIGLFTNGVDTAVGVNAAQFYVFNGADENASAILPFVIENGITHINTAMIKDASIDQGKIGPITFGKIVNANGDPVTTLTGLLKAEAIDVENLVVSEASTFGGDVSSTGLDGSDRPLWEIKQDGTVTFRSVTAYGITIVDGDFSGVLTASSLSAGKTITTYNFNSQKDDGTWETLVRKFEVKINATATDAAAATNSGLIVYSDNGIGIHVTDANFISGGNTVCYSASIGEGRCAVMGNNDKTRPTVIFENAHIDGPQMQLGEHEDQGVGPIQYPGTFGKPVLGRFYTTGYDLYIGMWTAEGIRWVSQNFYQEIISGTGVGWSYLAGGRYRELRKAQFNEGDAIPRVKISSTYEVHNIV